MPSEGPTCCWDHEDCPRDDCEGELEQQDRFNVSCLECRNVWTHVEWGDKHVLQTADGETVAEKPIAKADGGTINRLIDEDELRGDLDNPVVAMQAELQTVLDRYPGIQRANPEYVATLLIDLADSLRDTHNLDHEVSTHGNGVCVVEIEELGAVIGAPRKGPHADIDQDALDDLVEDGGQDD